MIHQTSKFWIHKNLLEEVASIKQRLTIPFSHPKQTSNNDPDQVQLDDEMEKVFGSVGTDKEKFELKRLNDDVLVDQSPLKYEETSRPATASLRPMDTSGASGANNGSSLPSTTPTSPISMSSKSESAAPKPSNDTTLADNSSNDFSEAVHDDPPPVVDQGSTLQGEQWVSLGHFCFVTHQLMLNG